MLAALDTSFLGLIVVVVIGNSLLRNSSVKLVDLKADNKVLESQQTGLLQAKNEINKYSNLEDVIQSVVPQDKDQAKAVREIASLAKKNGITLKSITFPSSNLGIKEPTTQSFDENTPTPSQAAPSISQAKPVEGIKGIYSLEMTIEPDNNVSYYQFINFLADLEKNQRTAQMTRIKIDPSSSGDSLGFSLTLNIFVKP